MKFVTGAIYYRNIFEQTILSGLQIRDIPKDCSALPGG